MNSSQVCAAELAAVVALVYSVQYFRRRPSPATPGPRPVPGRHGLFFRVVHASLFVIGIKLLYDAAGL